MALTVGLKRGGVLLSILVLPLTIPLLIFATAAMDAASMHLPVDGYLAILGALLAGTATLSPLRRRQRYESAFNNAGLLILFESGIETMWKTLHQLAIPPRLYQICGWFIPWLAIASVVVLTVGWIWGFGFAPADYQQGNSYRIIYLHVPAAIWSMGIYASMAVAAFIGLVWQMKMANLAVAAMAPIGAVFTFIALVTGSAWGKPMWGTWWVWDARLTSELVLLFLYVGVIALWHAFDDRRLAGRAAGILVLIGVVNLPIIHYSVEWWNTLHQGSTRMQQSIDPAMRSPLRWSIFGFLLLSATLTLMRMRNLILLMENAVRG